MAFARILPSILRAKSCTGKTRYPTRSGAKRAIAVLAKAKMNGHQGDLSEYHCEFCDGYHYGHKSKLMQQFEIPT